MKTLINMLALGMMSFVTYSQEPNNSATLIELEDVNVSAVNATYLATVQDENVPKRVAVLQQNAANFDVRSNKNFSEDVNTDTFEVVFRNPNGYIDAFYNNEGKIEMAYERFRNIVLPKHLRHKLYQGHQGWAMTENLYTSAYEDDHLIDRSYKIRLEKGDEKKNVVFHIPKQ